MSRKSGGAAQETLDGALGHKVGPRLMLDFRVAFALDHLDADQVEPLADAMRAVARGMGPVISSRVGGGPATVTTSLLALDAALAIDDARRVLHEALTALPSSPRVVGVLSQRIDHQGEIVDLGEATLARDLDMTQQAEAWRELYDRLPLAHRTRVLDAARAIVDCVAPSRPKSSRQ